MAHASTVILDDGSTSITVNGPAAPTNVVSEPITVFGETEDHTMFSYQPTATEVDTWTMTLKDLTNAMKLNLHDFFFTQVKGTTSTFTYTHTDEVARANCRFFQNKLSWRRNAAGLWDIEIKLRVPVEVV